MLWASGGGGGGYPGVVSSGYGALIADGPITSTLFVTHPFGAVKVLDGFGSTLFSAGENGMNEGVRVRNGIGLFQTTPPAAPTTGGAHTAGGTYTATEQAMLNAVYAALQSIGLVT